MRAAMGERKMKARITRARVMTERMIREKMISIMAWGCTILVLLISIGWCGLRFGNVDRRDFIFLWLRTPVIQCNRLPRVCVPTENR